MRLITLLIAAVVASSTSCLLARRSTVVVSAAPFHAELSPYGSWVVVEPLGRVWRPHPHLVGAVFVPYETGGHWVASEHGWIFETDWPFGWAVFHYGRWYADPRHGWVWMPGDVWGPSWVEWREGGGFVGWAPLPPIGIEVVVREYRPRWCFVETHHFLAREVWRHRLAPEREVGGYHAAVPVARAPNEWAVGPDPEHIARGVGEPVHRVIIGAPPPRGEVRPIARVDQPSPPPPSSGYAPPPPPRSDERPPAVSPPPPSADPRPPSSGYAPPPPPSSGTRPPAGGYAPPPPPRSDPRPPSAAPPPPSADVRPPPPPPRGALQAPPPVTPPPPGMRRPPPAPAKENADEAQPLKR